jgi:hypothetical protein
MNRSGEHGTWKPREVCTYPDDSVDNSEDDASNGTNYRVDAGTDCRDNTALYKRRMVSVRLRIVETSKGRTMLVVGRLA